MSKKVTKNVLDSVSDKKPTAKEIAKLKREVYLQNRKLLLICVAILVFAALILFSASHIAKWLTPTPWSYDGAVLSVLDGETNENQYLYNGLIFARQSNESAWTFQGNIRETLYEINMYYGPNEVSDIKSPDLAFAQIFSKKAVILTLNSDLDNVPTAAAHGAIAAIELGKVLGTKNQILNKVVMSATTRVAPNVTNYLAITCDNATKEVGVIQLELGEKTQIIVRPNCVVIRGMEPRELIRAADRFVYSLLGVIPLEAQAKDMTASTNQSKPQLDTTNVVNGTQETNLSVE